MAKYFVNPFAVGGTRAPIPESAQPSGEVSYSTGFTIDYSLDPLLNPNAKDVPRDKTNELYYEITLALQQYQQNGSPSFITDADNLGFPFGYDHNAIVNFNDGVNGIRLHRSLKSNNTNLPTDNSAWQMQPFYISGTETGTLNALQLNTSSVYQNFVFGDTAKLKITTTNTDASTLQIGNAPAVDIRKVSGSTLVPLYGYEMQSGGFYDFVFDGTFWILQNPSTDKLFYGIVTFAGSTGQLINASSVDKLLFTEVVEDDRGWWDASNYRFKPDIAGKYQIITNIYIETISASTQGFVTPLVYKNGSLFDVSYASVVADSIQVAQHASPSKIFYANGTTDYFEVFVNNSRLSSINVAYAGFSPGSGVYTSFQIIYLGQ